MSIEAIEAVRDAATALRSALERLPAKHRPSHAVAMLVARELADRYRSERGFVAEATSQLVASTGLSDGQVRDALRALHEVGCWVRVGAGNRHTAAKRQPGPLLPALATSRGYPAAYDDLDRGVAPVDRGVAPPTSRGYPALPPTPVDPRALVRRASAEVDARLAPLRATYSNSVDQVLAELTAAGYSTDWPSQLAAEVEQRCAARRRTQLDQPRTPASERWDVTDPDDDPSAPPVARPRPAA